MWTQEQEDRDFHYATDSEWDQASAVERGSLDTTRAWVLTDRDVWHPNPFYVGPPQPHPEDDHAWDELEAREAIFAAKAEAEAFVDLDMTIAAQHNHDHYANVDDVTQPPHGG